MSADNIPAPAPATSTGPAATAGPKPEPYPGAADIAHVDAALRQVTADSSLTDRADTLAEVQRELHALLTSEGAAGEAPTP